MKTSLIFFCLLSLLLIVSCGKNEPVLAYDGLTVGENLNKFKERYPKYDCIKTKIYWCTSGEEVVIEANLDETIYSIVAFSAVEDLTLKQTIDNLTKKYGTPNSINSVFDVHLAKWCLSDDCSKSINLKFQNHSSKKKLEKSKLEDSVKWRDVSICEIEGIPLAKCDTDFNYFHVTYRNDNLADVQFKKIPQLEKF
jgi:hypothetical protein